MPGSVERARIWAERGAALEGASRGGGIREVKPLLQSRQIGMIALMVCCQVMAASYWLAALKTAGTTHFWIDEVLAVWVARLPTAHAIITAIWNGAEFSPPTYDLLLHAWFRAFGSSLLTARLPSILAIFGTAIVIACLVWRRLGSVSAALAFGLVLNSPLFGFAVQARPYALLTALTAAALLAWSGCGRRGDRWRPAAIAAMLFASVSLHFYGVVAFAVLALSEAMWSLGNRMVRPAIWLAIVMAAAACVVWLPLMRHLAAFNSDDTDAPDFYGAPTLGHLADHVTALFVGSSAFLLFILAAILLIGAGCAAAHLTASKPRQAPAPENERDIAVMALALLAALPIGFGLALLVTHVFSARYALAATLGATLLFVLALRKAPFDRVIGGSLCAVLCIIPLLRAPPIDLSAQAFAALRKSTVDGPIVVSDGNLFLELMESADPTMRARIVHLARPPGVVDADTSAEHQVNRLLSSFRPDLPVKESATFFSANSTFSEVCRPGRSTDALCPWLLAKGWVVGAGAIGHEIAILKIRTGPPHAQDP